MKDYEKRFVNKYSPAMEDDEEEEPLYCMISPLTRTQERAGTTTPSAPIAHSTFIFAFFA